MQVSFEVHPRDGAIDETIRWAGKQCEIHLSIREGRNRASWLGDPQKENARTWARQTSLESFPPTKTEGSCKSSRNQSTS